MKKVHLLPNVITAFALTCGLFVIFKMSMVAPGNVTQRTLMEVSGLLLLAAFADLLDGAVARAMNAQSEFGGLFDSLADAISFGVAPSLIVLKTLALQPGTGYSFILTTAAMIYSVCGVLRLVRYNVTNKTIPADKMTIAAPEEKSKNFTGLPIPAAAASVISLNQFLSSKDFKSFFEIHEGVQVWITFFALVLIGYFMVSRWKFPSLKNLDVRVASFQVVFLTVISAALIIYGLLTHFALVFFGLSWAYLVVAWILSLVRIVAGKRAKVLEDFEPASEEEEQDL